MSSKHGNGAGSGMYPAKIYQDISGGAREAVAPEASGGNVSKLPLETVEFRGRGVMLITTAPKSVGKANPSITPI